MANSDVEQLESNSFLACTVCRNIQNFELLIFDMEETLADQWGDLTFSESMQYFNQKDANSLEFIALAIDNQDENDLSQIRDIITTATTKGIKIILIAQDVTPLSLHQLLSHGAHEFVPYPLPIGELQGAIERVRAKTPATEMHQEAPTPGQKPVTLQNRSDDQKGVLVASHGLAGGTGSSTLAVNLAWELATVSKKASPSVCLIDLDLQFGSVATYLDLSRREAVFELLTDTEQMDSESFGQALTKFEDTLNVLTAPPDMLPLDLISSEDVQRILDMAQKHFDFVIIDMPSTLVQWSEIVIQAADVYFAPIEIDMRCAQNIMRLKQALDSENLPHEKLRFVMNRAPKFTDLSGKSRVKRLAKNLDITIDVWLPDGGKPVQQAGDHGTPLAQAVSKNPLRKEIVKLATSLIEFDTSNSQAA